MAFAKIDENSRIVNWSEDRLDGFDTEFQNGDYVNARKIYHTLYEQSQKKVYLTEDAGLAFVLGDPDARDLIMQGIQKYPEEKNFNRLLVGQLVKEKRYEEAEKEILKL